MSRYLDQIFSCQRDQYTSCPPYLLLEKCSVPAAAVDQAELERAVWLWSRRPRYVLYDAGKVLWGRLTLFIVAVLFLVSLDIPGLLIAAALSFAVATLMLFDFYWRERWKRDYETCLYRVIRAYLR